MTRRRVVQAAAVAGVAAAVVTPATAASAADPAELTGADLVSADPLLHLLRRATYGPSPASIAEITSLGASAWLERQLSPGTLADTECDAVVARFPLINLSIAGVHAKVRNGSLKKHTWDVMRQTGYATLTRAVWSNRQLYEVMCEFWSNHLNVTCPSSDCWDSRQDYDRLVIRRHAMGRFADMLKASARHPAMLSYLDNRYSTRLAPNENYGRELLELHTVGLGYSEADVKYAARLLTGLTVNPATGYSMFDRRKHAVGAVRVLGFQHANRTDYGGGAAIMAMLDYLAMHPATARRIATKLCVRFVSDDPPASLVNRLAQVYLANRTAIVPVLRALFTSAEFAASVGQKVRTPYEDVCATVRALGHRPEPSGTASVQALYWSLEKAGQLPLAWAPPNGYPDTAAAWASPSGYLTRWNVHLNIVQGWYPKELVRPDLFATLVGARPATYGGLVDAVAQRLFGRTLRAEHTEALTQFFGKTPASTLRSNHPAVGWLFPYLVGVMLDSPYFQVR
ncbi:DUF1800 domain-containing protein [Spirilliplanes yamanashiensis]|uniref:DUF1800 domain-containing protein n=1 Tax=Spirilliplanes yamanashiensis TaxID=42233 RepID=UPI00194E020D|nr:DUF1800 domain-containing protein [Spirilliplanes yamanashiensis]MDP9820157.1 uncharacterized protein (DUF1800 family) [Spirilliplanes yamanashiensis]